MTGPAPRLLLDAGRYSLADASIGGIGLRVAELADTLAGAFRVRVAVEDPAGAVPTGAAEVVAADRWPALLREAAAVLFFDMPDRDRLEDAVAARRLVVSENAVPIEQLEYPSLLGGPDPDARHAGLLAAYRRQLEVSHHFLCRSAVERATLVANLCLAGRVTTGDLARSRTLDHLVSLVPIGFSARSLRAAGAACPRPGADVLWTGGIWSYLDPEVLVDAVGRCHAGGVPVTAEFLYAAPGPDNAAALAKLRGRVEAAGLGHAVSLRTTPLRHTQRDAVLRGARALVCVARPGIENQTCVRLRARDSRLYGIPAIVDPYGPTAAELAADGLARVLPEVTAAALARVLADISGTAGTLGTAGTAGTVGTAGTAGTVGTVGDRPGHEPVRDRYRYDRTLGRFAAWLEAALR